MNAEPLRSAKYILPVLALNPTMRPMYRGSSEVEKMLFLEVTFLLNQTLCHTVRLKLGQF